MAARFIMTDRTATIIHNHYVCNICWGPLTLEESDTIRDPGDGRFLSSVIYCSNPNCTGSGFVTKRYTERRCEQSGAEYEDVYKNLAEILGLTREPIPIEQALRELGF